MIIIARLIGNFFQWLDRSMVWRGRPTLDLLSLATLGLISGAMACSPIAAGAPPPQAQPYTFYRFNPFAENKLVPLAPEILTDQRDGPTLKPGLFSADGSTRVDVEYPPGRDLNSPNLNPDDVWVVSRDFPTGTERSRFHPPVPGLMAALSPDGTRLALELYPPVHYPPIAEWYVLDTATGQLLTHLKDADTSCFRGTGVFDLAIQQRVYCVVDPEITEATGPEPMRLVAYDLESGDKAAEIELPEVLIGGRQSEQMVNDQPVWTFLEPVVVLSPDGRQLAVVPADAAQVTLIEAESLTVKHTFALNRSASMLDWFAPAVAQAKGPSEGVIRQAVFSPEGQYLYIFSQELWTRRKTRRLSGGCGWLI